MTSLRKKRCRGALSWELVLTYHMEQHREACLPVAKDQQRIHRFITGTVSDHKEYANVEEYLPKGPSAELDST
jgi:hypothetical protein